MDNKYNLGEKCGSDSVSEFFRPANPLPGRTIIIKRIFPELAANSKRVACIQESVLLFSPLIHQNVARVLEFVGDEAQVFYSVEVCDGQNICGWCDELRPIEQILHLLRGLAEGLAAIHQAGVIHRNLKLEVVFFSSNGMFFSLQ